jgi:hypothetical protein
MAKMGRAKGETGRFTAVIGVNGPAALRVVSALETIRHNCLRLGESQNITAVND